MSFKGHSNEFGQPIGFPIPDWKERPLPPRTPIVGTYCRLEPLDPARHAPELWEANQGVLGARNWTYLPMDPPPDFPSYLQWLEKRAVTTDPLFFTIISAATGKAVGLAAYLRIDPIMGVIEIGHLNFSRLLQRTPASTEAMYLMMRRAFDELGYRRYEWKCDSLNAPSRRAAERLGFQFEGTFRQAMVYKGRNRDTDWLSISDGEWPALKKAFELWLAPANFDPAGLQIRSLDDLRRDK